MSFIISQSLFSPINLRLTDNLYGGAVQTQDIIIVGIDDTSLQKIGRWPWNRNQFATIIEKLENASVIGIDVGFYETSFDDEILANSMSNKSNIVIASQYGKFEIKSEKIYGKELLSPIEKLSFVDTAYVNIPLDIDGVSRSINYNIEGEIQSFSEVISSKYLKSPVSVENNEYLINFVGGPNTFKTYSFYDVIEGNVDLSLFENKIILIGATAPDLRDTFLVPTSKGKMMAGVEIHANTINTILFEQSLERQSKQSIYLTVFLTSLTILFFLNYLKLGYSTLLSLILLFGYLFLAILMFDKRIILNLIYVPITIILTYVSFTASSYLDEQKAKKEIQSAFGKYLSPVVIEQLINDPSRLKLGGEKRKITVFFSDIANFTSISEKLGAEQMTSLLNEYLDEMTSIIMENGGLVDKFIGDAVMAFWGAPIDQYNQSRLAAKSSIEQQEKLKELRPIWKEKYGVDVHIRIGLAYGEALVGNMGSKQRFDYTCIGDIVNLSSRLEAINKSYGTDNMVSEPTYDRIHKEFYLREVDSVRVKGKKKPTKIYELISRIKGVSKEKKKIVKEYEKGLGLYKKQKFIEAAKVFENLYSEYEDGPSKVFYARCLALRHEKLPKNWDGVFTMTSK